MTKEEKIRAKVESMTEAEVREELARVRIKHHRDQMAKYG